MDNNFSVLVGKTVTEIQGGFVGSEEITFSCSDGTMYRMFHSQECCESVSVEDIIGDIDKLIGSVVQSAYVDSNCGNNCDGFSGTDDDEEQQWTFYRITTMNGETVTIRWYGTSNGYYSIDVSFVKLKTSKLLN